MSASKFSIYVDALMDSIDITWNDNDNRDRRRVRWREYFNLYNVNHGKMWEEKFEDDFHIEWANKKADEYMREVEDTWERWRIIEIEDICETIYQKYADYEAAVFWVEGNSDYRGIWKDKETKEVIEDIIGMSTTRDGDEDTDGVDRAYIDSAAEDHIWRMDTGYKYLKHITTQSGKC